MLNILTQNYLTRGFWGDEAWTAGISRLPIEEIITITGQDFHPPLYYFIVHFLGGLFDYKEVPIRLISTAFFLLVPLVSYHLIKLFKQSKHTALLGSLLILFSPILLTYAFEARSYGLLAFESAVSALIFWHAKDEKKGQYLWRILYFVIGGLMIYTHYYAWFILASHAVYLLLFERSRILPMLVSALGILIAQLPWLPTLLAQTSSVKGSYWIGPINSQTHWEFFYRVTGGDITTLFQKPLAILIGSIILLGIVLTIFKKRLSSYHLFLLTWLIIPTLIPTIISMVVTPVFFYRYLIFSSIPLLILTVIGLQHLSRKLGLVLIMLILGMQLFVDYKIFAQYPRSMRETTTELYEIKKPGDGPVYTVLPSFAEVMYYTAPHDQIIVKSEGLVQFSGLSLLNAYVRLGYTKIGEPEPGTSYYFLTPEKTVEYIQSKN
jgi:mannosyltransferase